MGTRSVRNPKRNAAAETRSADLLLETQDLLHPFSVGSWTPPVDICQTAHRIVIRLELPGVEGSDISVSCKGQELRIRGLKREQPRKLLCYYCLERRYGRFDRLVSIEGIVNPRQSHAHMQKGILTIELPRLKDRRGNSVDIPIEAK